jgi:hypothetical protein
VNQRDALALWWLHLDELTRRRVLRLHPDDALPGDIAKELRLHDVVVHDLGTYVADDGEHVQVWAQPPALLALVQHERSRTRSEQRREETGDDPA